MEDLDIKLYNEIIRKCELCNGLGYLKKKNNKTIDCKCTKLVKIIKLKKMSNIPSVYFKIPISKYEYIDNGKENIFKKRALQMICCYIRDFDYYQKQNIGLFLYGPNSRRMGMTLLVSYVLRHAIEKMIKSVLMVHFPTLKNEMAIYDNKWEDNKEKYYVVDHLFIDSLNTEGAKNAVVIDKLNALLDFRAANRKNTHFVSYVDMNKIKGFFGEVIYHLIQSNTSQIQLSNMHNASVIPSDISNYLYNINRLEKVLKYVKSKNRETISLNEIDKLILKV